MGKSVLISLGDSRMKDVAEVLGSKSCVRILDLLGEEDLTVSDIAGRLKMKLNTVDYNVKKLVGAGLVEKSDHWWSVKGRRMIVYRVADRSIVISPRRSIARQFLWVLGLTGLAGLFIRERNPGIVFEEASSGGGGVAMMAKDSVLETAPMASSFSADYAEGIILSVNNQVGFWAGLAGWEWFLVGAWSAIVLFFVYSMIAERGSIRPLSKFFRFEKPERRNIKL